MKRSKTSLPLTRFVAPKRLTGNINHVLKIDTPTSSLTPAEDDDSTLKGTDETAENEEVEDAITTSRTNMDTSGSTIDGDVNTTIPEEGEEGPDPAAILKSVETLHQDFIKHQNNFVEFVDKANSRIIKLEESISANAQESVEKDYKYSRVSWLTRINPARQRSMYRLYHSVTSINSNLELDLTLVDSHNWIQRMNLRNLRLSIRASFSPHA